MNVARTSCEECVPGQYNYLEQQTECQDCAAGQYSLETGLASIGCSVCPTGYFNTVRTTVDVDR